jgi:alpha-mannosidase
MPGEHNVREVHVVFNTHWDREFRESFEVTRRQLVDMMDITLDLLASDPACESFTLDAHVILLEDYLEMRPERREQVVDLLRERRLFLGPWYTLPDSMNVGGEALVRNFLRARTVADALGATCMTAGYSPNNWGQPSQMPQIFRGFGVDSALIYRGISPHECPSEFLWVGPDGSEIIGHRFARLARYNWYYLVFRPVTRGVEPTDKRHVLAGSTERPFRIADDRSRATANFRLLSPHDRADDEAIVPAIEAMLDLEGPDSSTGLFLAMHGHDMSVLHPKDAHVVARAAERLKDKYDIRVSNLEDFIARVRASIDRECVVRLTGERRMNLKEGFWTYLLPCTISARTYLKVLNTRVENALIGEAEPLSCLAAAFGGEYPRGYLDRGWRFLLGNHTHDANAGCAPDRVCEDMEYRYRQCLDIANVCAEDAMKHVAGRIRGGDGEGDIRLAVFNPLAMPRDEVLDVEVALPMPCDATALEIVDPEGRLCPVQAIGSEDDSLFVDNIWDVPTYADVRRIKARVAFGDLPAVGYRSFRVRGTASSSASDESLLTDTNTLENEYIVVAVRSNGAIDLADKVNHRAYVGLNTYRDQGEAGNAWGHEPPAGDELIESIECTATIACLEAGPVAATIQSTIHLELPVDCEDGVRRNPDRMPFRIVTRYTVLKGDPRLHVQVEFDNCVRDHWLRVLFPTGIHTDVVHADTHFDIVERRIRHPDSTGWIERFRGTAPMHSMVSLSDGEAGLAILTEGLFEYEVFDTLERTIAVSLVRSFPIKLQVSEEKRQVLPDRGVQCPGRQIFRYAILPHRGVAVDGDVLRWARRFGNPPRVAQVTPSGGTLPEAFSLVRAEGKGIVVTAVKQAERSEELLVRLFNSGVDRQDATVIFGCPVGDVRTAQLDETPLDRVPIDGKTVRITVEPRKIVTLLVEVAALAGDG